MTHGNALSVYLLDPAGNRVERTIDVSWHVSQLARAAAPFNLPEEKLVACARARQHAAGFLHAQRMGSKMAQRMQPPTERA